MPDTPSPGRIVRFGDFEIDLRAGHIRKHGVKIRLREQSFKVLAALLEHPGEVVTRDELRQHLWPEDVFVDFDNNLNSAMVRLREALNDSAERPHFIETLPKRGYRFIGTLSKPAGRKIRLVVLPLVNEGDDPAEEYISDAITEEIISELAGVAPEHLAVFARDTAMYYKGKQKDVSQIGRELGADFASVGTIRRADVRIRLSIQLIRISDQSHVWADTYDVKLRDIIQVEKEAAQAIAAQLGIEWRPSTAKSRPENFEAYNLYLQGRHLFAKSTRESMSQGLQCLKEAISRDPRFALAYDAVAEFHYYLGFFGFVPPRESCSTGVFYALRAIELDNTLAETHALLGQYRKLLDYDWPEVQRELALALQLNPSSPLVRVRYAMNGLMPHGRTAEAISELERALEWDPMSAMTRQWLGVMFLLDHQYDRAIDEARRLLEMDASSYWAYFILGVAYREKRMFGEAVAAHRRASELSGGSPVMLGWLGLAIALSGKPAEARALLEHLHASRCKAYVPPTSIAWIYLGLGEIDNAFHWMDLAVEERDDMIMAIKTYAFLDPIRSDPRYFALLRKMHLEP